MEKHKSRALVLCYHYTRTVPTKASMTTKSQNHQHCCCQRHLTPYHTPLPKTCWSRSDSFRLFTSLLPLKVPPLPLMQAGHSSTSQDAALLRPGPSTCSHGPLVSLNCFHVAGFFHRHFKVGWCGVPISSQVVCSFRKGVAIHTSLSRTVLISEGSVADF